MHFFKCFQLKYVAPIDIPRIISNAIEIEMYLEVFFPWSECVIRVLSNGVIRHGALEGDFCVLCEGVSWKALRVGRASWFVAHRLHVVHTWQSGFENDFFVLFQLCTAHVHTWYYMEVRF